MGHSQPGSPTLAIVELHIQLGNLTRWWDIEEGKGWVAAPVKMVSLSSQPAGKQPLKSSHGLEKVGSRRRRGNDMGEKKKPKRGEFWRTITTDNMLSGFFFIEDVQLHSQV